MTLREAGTALPELAAGQWAVGGWQWAVGSWQLAAGPALPE